MLLLVVFVLFSHALARTVHLDWEVGWVTAAPDGFARPVIGINGQWPCPTVEINKGDRLVVNVHNNLGNQSTSIHWHGIYQTDTPHMDGSAGVTQCPIASGSSMRYNFKVDQSGTYWYHAHDQGQYPDGLWGPLIVHDKEATARYNIDEEVIITLTDWYHEQMAVLSSQYQSTANVLTNDGDEPTPNTALINAALDTKIHVKPNKTYLFRVLCVGNWPGHAFIFDDHEMQVVEVDGVWLDPYDAGLRNLRLATGQRMSILVHTKNSTEKNYAIWNTMDINMLFLNEGKLPPRTFNPNTTAHLVYDEAAPLPSPPDIHVFDFVDDVNFVPADREPLLEPVDHYLTFDMANATFGGLPRYVLNNESYYQPTEPSLYTALSNPSNLSAYGTAVPIVLKYGDVVQVAVNDIHENLHPFHLHGHTFQVVQRTMPNQGYYGGIEDLWRNISATPVKRDTIMVQQYGHAVIRFRAKNPGVWLFHCHIEWHVEAGLIATFIEAPEKLSHLRLPQDHKSACAAAGVNGTFSGNNTGGYQDAASHGTETHSSKYPTARGLSGRA